MTTLVENPNLIFIHIPKNGGSSVTRWLRENLQGIKGTVTHGGMQHIKKEFPHAVNYPSFAIVRNPWDRVVSSYFFKKKKEKIDYSFEDWLYNYSDNNSNWFTFKTPQVEWLRISPTWVLKFENLSVDFQKIQEYTNCSLSLTHKNSTEHSDYKTYYTEKTKRYVETLFEEDIDTFKYKF